MPSSNTSRAAGYGIRRKTRSARPKNAARDGPIVRLAERIGGPAGVIAILVSRSRTPRRPGTCGGAKSGSSGGSRVTGRESGESIRISGRRGRIQGHRGTTRDRPVRTRIRRVSIIVRRGATAVHRERRLDSIATTGPRVRTSASRKLRGHHAKTSDWTATVDRSGRINGSAAMIGRPVKSHRAIASTRRGSEVRHVAPDAGLDGLPGSRPAAVHDRSPGPVPSAHVPDRRTTRGAGVSL